MQTINELESYLVEEGFDLSQISIGNHRAVEGVVIQKSGKEYIFGYSERGKLNIIKKFSKEEDLVIFSKTELEEDKWNKAHLVAWTWTNEEILLAETELEAMNIPYERNDIPDYRFKGDRAYRIFVFGKDVEKLQNFIARYRK